MTNPYSCTIQYKKHKSLLTETEIGYNYYLGALVYIQKNDQCIFIKHGESVEFPLEMSYRTTDVCPSTGRPYEIVFDLLSVTAGKCIYVPPEITHNPKGDSIIISNITHSSVWFLEKHLLGKIVTDPVSIIQFVPWED